MGKRLSQLNEVEQVSNTDYLLVDGEEYLESKKILIKNIDIKDFKTENLNKDFEGKQDVLIDGKNIKTINGESILGKGNLTIKDILTEADKTDIANLVLANFIDVSEVGQWVMQ